MTHKNQHTLQNIHTLTYTIENNYAKGQCLNFEIVIGWSAVRIHDTVYAFKLKWLVPCTQNKQECMR